MDDILTKEQAVKIDKILNLLIEKRSLESKSIHSASMLEMSEVNFLLTKTCYLQFEGDSIVDYEQDSDNNFDRIRSKYNTEKFLKSGGCIKWREDQIKLQAKEIERQKLEFDKLKNDLETFKITKRQYSWNLGLAITGIIIAIIGILLQFL